MALNLKQLAFDLDQAEFDPESRPEQSASELLKEILFLAHGRFWQYTPAQLKVFESSLVAWLSNTAFTPADMRTLLELVPALQFVDRDDMAALYRGAMRGPIARWIADDAGWTTDQLFTTDAAATTVALAETWFCPVTDSMDIGQFLRANHISDATARPPWKVLAKFGDFEKVRNWAATRNYKRLVLLEDFVGSGTQAAEAVKRALSELGGMPVMFVPLIASQQGIKNFGNLRRKYRHLSVEPVFTIPTSMHLFATEQNGEPHYFKGVRDIVAATFNQVRRPCDTGNEIPKNPLGFSGSYGLLLVQHTNCPNNTVPLIWRDSSHWSGLFPRVSRWQ